MYSAFFLFLLSMVTVARSLIGLVIVLKMAGPAICAILTDTWLILLFLNHRKSELEVKKGRISMFLKIL